MRDKKDESGVGLAHLKDGLVDLLAGTAGGIANVYSGQPLDTIKVKMQTFPKLYNNWVACLRHTFRTEGIRGLYAGTVPALVANISENAILFASYGFCQKAVANLFGYKSTMEMSPLENATAGSLAAFFAALALCPTELVKCKLQAQAEVDSTAKKCHLSPSTPSSICREMYRSGGLRSFYTGFTPTIIREMPGYFCFFGAYEFTRKLLTPEGKRKEEIGLLRTAVSGGIAGMTLWAVIFPADVVKSRMQVGQSGRFSAIFMRILRTEGISALYKGLTPTLIRTCVATASLFIAVENTKHFLNNL